MKDVAPCALCFSPNRFCLLTTQHIAARKPLPQKLILADTEARPTKTVQLGAHLKFFTLCPMFYAFFLMSPDSFFFSCEEELSCCPLRVPSRKTVQFLIHLTVFFVIGVPTLSSWEKPSFFWGLFSAGRHCEFFWICLRRTSFRPATKPGSFFLCILRSLRESTHIYRRPD